MASRDGAGDNELRAGVERARAVRQHRMPQQDIARLGETRTGAAHCPSSNGRLGAGLAPARALLDALFAGKAKLADQGDAHMSPP